MEVPEWMQSRHFAVLTARRLIDRVDLDYLGICQGARRLVHAERLERADCDQSQRRTRLRYAAYNSPNRLSRARSSGRIWKRVIKTMKTKGPAAAQGAER